MENVNISKNINLNGQNWYKRTILKKVWIESQL